MKRSLLRTHAAIMTDGGPRGADERRSRVTTKGCGWKRLEEVVVVVSFFVERWVAGVDGASGVQNGGVRRGR